MFFRLLSILPPHSYLLGNGFKFLQALILEDEADAIARIYRAAENPNYDLFGHNCEHFARYVATGRRESTQIQLAVAGWVALVFVR